jgi:proline iminopeptidase
MSTNLPPSRPAPFEGYIPIDNTALYYRVRGNGQPIIILHGGPDFDHTYLLPDMDSLSDPFRLIYYDQRGRGKSAANVQPEDVTIQSDVEDLDDLRAYFQLETVTILGHSWGGLLALEYAIRHPSRVSHLILMNSAPVSTHDYMYYREDRRKREPDNIEMLKAMSSRSGYQEGDPDAVARYYRVHFKAALSRQEDLDRIITSLRLSFTKEGILLARGIEDRLMDETRGSSEYDLLPKLKQLNIPTLVIHGDHDFVPLECALHIVQSIDEARFALLKDCGHFSYLECPGDVRKEISAFLRGT